MKLKAIFAAALLALGMTAAVAVAKPPPGKGKPAAVAAKQEAKRALKAAKENSKEMRRCRGGHMLLRGEVQSVDAAKGEFALLVERANKHARALVGKQATVAVGEKTRVLRRGPAGLTGLAAGDTVKVLVRRCRDAEGDAAMLAKLVVAVGAKKDEDDDDTSTSTSTETTSTTTTTAP